jgi:hypothetical protein
MGKYYSNDDIQRIDDDIVDLQPARRSQALWTF